MFLYLHYNQRSYVIIIARKEGGAWELTPQAVDRSDGQGTADVDGAAEVDGARPSAMVVKDVVGPSVMAVESDSVGTSPMVTKVGRYAQM